MKKTMDENVLKENFLELNKIYLNSGIPLETLERVVKKKSTTIYWFSLVISAAILLISILYEYDILNSVRYILIYAKGVRCIVPNNYFVWEATRQISNCSFCINVSSPIILHNASKEEFLPYAYSSKPIVIKNAFNHWPAMKVFDFNFFKDLYYNNEEAYRSVDEECQFLHFKSDFTSLRDVFSMHKDRISNKPGKKSWYVGWGNCHPQILNKMRQYYPKPHFLPEDCEMPSKEYVFMGYGAGATMHLDFISRLMWQAQIKGEKMWHVRPAPECEQLCKNLSFSVDPGDAVLLDTRVWYHGTTIIPGQFSLSIQSEYG
ncbi:hypothetical protein WA026_016390 [Henosepilachna vigintioctopunctata]|uniref:Cupin-like domain-containing protein n=1 Tax=Henosepilachna vigintioctopunctata TaxID=420089 RepID=A0AAW1UNG9_9CUCU